MGKEFKKQRSRGVSVLQRHYNWFTHIGYVPIMQSISKYDRMIITMQKPQGDKMLYVTLELDLDKLKVDRLNTPFLRITRRTTVRRNLKGFDLHDKYGQQLQFYFTRKYREKTIWI